MLVDELNRRIKEQRLAGFWIRLPAFAIDIGLILSALYFIDKIFWGIVTTSAWRSNGLPMYSSLYTIFLFPVVFVVYFFLFYGSYSTTIGKATLRLKVVNESFKSLSYKQAIIRTLSYFISNLFYSLGFFWIIFNSKKQAWHDLIAKTYVVRL